MSQLGRLIACLDLAGCPNRCRHCWLGVSPNGRLDPDDLRYLAASFRPHVAELEVVSWYREPDYRDDYQQLWQLERELSSFKTPHFELVSVWRTVRDEAYAPWLFALGVRRAQLTLFGGRDTTDRYYRRSGAYDELLQAVDILLRHNIAPRLQIFVNRENLAEMPDVVALIDELGLERRCAEIGQTFDAFVHQGSCDGENAKLYSLRVTPDDIQCLPPRLVGYTLRYTGKAEIMDVFGQTESALCATLAREPGPGRSTDGPADGSVVFYVDGNWDVYPTYTQPAPFWRLGNLKRDGASTVIDRYLHHASQAQHAWLTVPLRELVARHGDPCSPRLFTQDDYVLYLLNRYCLAMAGEL